MCAATTEPDCSRQPDAETMSSNLRLITFPRSVKATQYGALPYDDVEQSSGAKLSARINYVRTKLDEVYKSSAIKLIGGLIGTAVVVLGLAGFLFWD